MLHLQDGHLHLTFSYNHDDKNATYQIQAASGSFIRYEHHLLLDTNTTNTAVGKQHQNSQKYPTSNHERNYHWPLSRRINHHQFPYHLVFSPNNFFLFCTANKNSFITTSSFNKGQSFILVSPRLFFSIKSNTH